MRMCRAVLLLLSALAGGGCSPLPSPSAVDARDDTHSRSYNIPEGDLLHRLKLLAKIVSSSRNAPPHLQLHARRMSSLSLEELHEHPDHPYTLDVVVAALESLSTEEQERLDVWLTQEELDRIANIKRDYTFELAEATSPALQFSDIDGVPHKWFSGTIPYCFERTGDYSVTDETIDVMRAAFEQAQSEINTLSTCLTFVEQATCDVNVDMIIVGKYDVNSCYMSSGAYTGAVYINLGWCDILAYKGSMIHEIGHALGLGHEHKRPDRDLFISINWTAIEPSWWSQYDAYSDQADTFRPYNYDSLMHYGASSGPAIITPGGNSVRIGRRTGGFDGNDVSQIRHIYQCSPFFANNPSAVAIAYDFSCPDVTPVEGQDPDRCALELRLAGSNCSVLQFNSVSALCSCCNDPINATISLDTNLYQVHLGSEFHSPPSPPAAPPAPPSLPRQSIYFDFSTDSGGWSMRQNAWTLSNTGTPSSDTGPSEGPTGPGSYFYFAETSSPRVQGDVFEFVYDGSGCSTSLDGVSFSYSMYGDTMGDLSVIAGGSTPFFKSGDQGSSWLTATNIALAGAPNFTFSYVTGSSWTGDAAIGAVTVYCTPDALSPSPVSPPSPSPPPLSPRPVAPSPSTLSPPPSAPPLPQPPSPSTLSPPPPAPLSPRPVAPSPSTLSPPPPAPPLPQSPSPSTLSPPPPAPPLPQPPSPSTLSPSPPPPQPQPPQSYSPPSPSTLPSPLPAPSPVAISRPPPPASPSASSPPSPTENCVPCHRYPLFGTPNLPCCVAS